MRPITTLRRNIKADYFDYTQLMDVLSDYSKPRDVVTSLLKKGEIIRLRKGFYVFPEFWRKKPFEPAVLSSLIYGPSVLSLDYSLAWYGLIPEKVTVYTSITPGRSKIFNTPIGQYKYTGLFHEAYAAGITIHKTSGGNMLMSEPIKALADKVWTDKRFVPTSRSSYANYLFQDLRIDESVLEGYLTLEKIDEVAGAYQKRKINWLFDFIKKDFGLYNE